MSEKYNSLGKDVLEKRRESKSLASADGIDEFDYWPINTTGLDGYTHDFRGVLGDKSLLKRAGEIKETGKKIYAMELMGYGGVLEDLAKEKCLDAGLAVALSNPWTAYDEELHRKDIAPIFKPEHHISLLSGDVLSKKLWAKMSQWLEDNDSRGFDFILFSPGEGMNAIPKDRRMYGYLMNQVWQRLNPKGGTFYGKVPNALMQEMPELVDKLNLIWGVNVIFSKDTGAIAITRKSPQNEDVLPPPDVLFDYDFDEE